MSKIVSGFYSIRPGPPLSTYVDMMWYCYHEKVNKKSLALPLTNFELVINLTAEYKVYAVANKKLLLNNSEGWISGLQMNPFIKVLKGENENIGVLFKRYGVADFIKNDAKEFTNNFVPLSDIWKHEIVFLREQIKEAKRVNRKFFLLEKFLTNKLHKISAGSGEPLADYIIDEMEEGALGKSRIYEISQRFNVTRKTLHKYIVHRVGSPASVFKRLVIFNKMLKEMHMNPDKKLTHLGYDYHYFDQSHFIKDFSSLAGITPGEYVRNVRNRMVDRNFANYVALPVT